MVQNSFPTEKLRGCSPWFPLMKNPQMCCFSVAGKLSDIKSTWSSGPISHTQASLSHELWKVPRNTTAPTRPPPGLTNTKPSSTWGASPLGWTGSYSSGTHSSSSASFLALLASTLYVRLQKPELEHSWSASLLGMHLLSLYFTFE